MMEAPLFERRVMSHDTFNYYARNIGVCVYGTKEQYRRFSDLLGSSSKCIKLMADERGGMDLLILPPAKATKRDFIVFHERLVHQNGKFNMELIVGGSSKGFGSLVKSFKHMVKCGSEDPDDHWHIDDCSEPLLVIPSVFLNISGPVENIEDLLPSIAPPDSDDLPPDMDWREPENWKYEPIESYGDLFGNLPTTREGLRKRFRQAKDQSFATRDSRPLSS